MSAIRTGIQRYIGLFLLLTLVLSGCKPAPDPELPLTLMDNREAAGTSESVWRIPNEHLAGMLNPDIRLLGDDLLVYSNVYDARMGNYFTMKRISLRDGSLMAERSFSCGSFVTVQTNGETLGLCDMEQGTVKLYDGGLEETASYTIRPPEEKVDYTANWYLSQNLQNLYTISIKNGAFKRQLESGEITPLIENTANLCGESHPPYSVTLNYADLATQRTKYRLLNLETDALEEIPVNATSAIRAGDIWLTTDLTAWGKYHLITPEGSSTIQWPGNRLELLMPNVHLLAVDSNAQVLDLYNTDGTLLSRCDLSGEPLAADCTILWSDLWKGYFFLAMDGNAHGSLMFWDTSVSAQGDPLPIQPESNEVPGGLTADPALYQRAKELGERYGVEIRIADQCALTYEPSYRGSAISDTQWISDGLDVLERGLSLYPQGYFEQLCFDTIQTVRIELVGTLSPIEGSGAISAAAFAQKQSDCYLMVFDLYSIDVPNFCHEVTHLTDAKLAWDASLREGALFSEEAWMALNPPGFQYAMSYTDTASTKMPNTDTQYFMFDYSLTFPTEDRATMVSSAMTDRYLTWKYWAGLLNKLDYYSQCIRDCFDTTGWPDATQWEKPLKK